jgi:hypothetical protein
VVQTDAAEQMLARNVAAILKHHSRSISPMLFTALPPPCISLQKQCAQVVKVQAHVRVRHQRPVRNVGVVAQLMPTKEYFRFPHRANVAKVVV